MRRIMKRALFLCSVAIFVLSTTAFALNEKRIVYSGTTEPGMLVSLMLVEPDADPDNLSKEEIHKVEIIKADADGEYSHYFDVEDIEIDETGAITNYKLLSNVVPDVSIEEIVAEKIEFSSFASSPVEENGVLYVPIEETLNLIGGETVSYTYNEETKTYTGKANNGEFIIVMGKDTLEVDWVDIELPGALKKINGTDMMPAYAIKYLLKTGDVVYTSSDTAFGLTDGVKEAGHDWEQNVIGANIDQLVDASTRVVIDSTNLSNIFAYDPNSADITAIEKGTLNSSYGYIYTITNTPAEGETGGKEVALQINKSDDSEIPFEHDHIGVLHLKARATYSADESGAAQLVVQLQRRAAAEQAILQYSSALYEQIALPYTAEPQWQDIYLMADSGTTELSDGSWMRFVPQGKASTVEICDIQFWDFGLRDDCADKISLMQPKEGYKGIEDDHVWRQEAWNRIEKYRKEDITVEVVDANGNPVSGAVVDVKMTENEFMFGAALSESEVLDKYLDLDTVGGQTLDSFMYSDMNVGVAADMLKAGGVVNTDAESGINMVNEFLSRGKRVRGHAVFWDGESMMPFDRATQMTYEEIYKQTMDYVRPLAYTFKGKLAQWDVLNEPHDSNYIRSNYQTTRLYTDIFKEVKKIDPDVKLYVNETGIEGKSDKYFVDRVPEFVNIVKQMQADGAPIDGIGIQAHCTTYHYPQGFYHQLDECSQIVDEVAVTEYDFYNGNTDYAPNHMEDMMLATFSHPKATAFVVWGVEDSMHWRWNADAAPFFNRDWTSKPAYDTWKRLLNEDFATNTTLKTNANGKATVRAFRGDYDITCTYNGKTVTVPLGNTVDGGSSVKFVVGNTISGTASNGIREQKAMIEFKNMTEAKKELDSISEPYYKGVIFDRNFNDSETSDLAVNGGELRFTTEGKVRYEDTELHHETMFYTLDSDASGTLTISTGVSTAEQQDTKLSDIVYDNGEYYIKAIDGHVMELDKNKLYTLDTAVIGDKVVYTITLSDGVAATHSCTLTSSIDTQNIEEVSYLFDSSCSEGDILKLHNSRLFEYKDGELIVFSDTDYETYVLDESMKDFDVNSVEYLGTALTEAPKDWGIIGKDSSTADFAYKAYGAYASAARSNPNGEHSLVKGFDPISDGESLEFTFNMLYDAPAQWHSTGGYAYVGLGSADKSKYIKLISHDYDQWNGFSSKLLDLDDTETEISGGTTNVWNKNNLTVTFTLTPSADGTTYDASISIKPRTGSEIREAHISSAFTADEVKQIDTFFLSSCTYSYESKEITRQGETILGVKNLKLRKYGKTMYSGGAAKLSPGESASLGIMYNNITGVYRPAIVIIAEYDEHDSLISTKTKECTMNPGKGAFSFNINNANDSIAKYKVFLWNGLNSMTPYKKSDVITIKE